MPTPAWTRRSGVYRPSKMRERMCCSRPGLPDLATVRTAGASVTKPFQLHG